MPRRVRAGTKRRPGYWRDGWKRRTQTAVASLLRQRSKVRQVSALQIAIGEPRILTIESEDDQPIDERATASRSTQQSPQLPKRPDQQRQRRDDDRRDEHKERRKQREARTRADVGLGRRGIRQQQPGGERHHTRKDAYLLHGLVAIIDAVSAFGAPIVVVSGLPRSGTSMVMGMLEAGGLEIMTDGIRVADSSNPLGYYEYERVKTLDKDADKSWLEAARGKAIKIISFFLKDLPDSNRYRILFMNRDLDEVLASQRTMLHALGERPEPAADERLVAGYRAHLRVVNDLLFRRPCFELLALNYPDVIAQPSEQVDRINRFLWGGLDVVKMAAYIDPALYRNRRP